VNGISLHAVDVANRQILGWGYVSANLLTFGLSSNNDFLIPLLGELFYFIVCLPSR
jgi:hypothetical protein